MAPPERRECSDVVVIRGVELGTNNESVVHQTQEAIAQVGTDAWRRGARGIG